MLVYIIEISIWIVNLEFDKMVYMKILPEKIYGKLTDEQGRCVHYHSELDIIANKCSVCRKFYACYKCHDELENHPFGTTSQDEKATVMCGVCGKTFSYNEYSGLEKCPSCGSGFNPRCALHKSCYVASVGSHCATR